MHKLNLMPEDILIKRRYRRIINLILLFIVITMILFISIFFYLDYKINLLDKQIEKREKLNTKFFDQQLYEDRKQRKSIYSEITKNRILPSFIVERIITQKPEEITLISIGLKDKTLLAIKGESCQVEKIVKLLYKIEELDYIEKTTLELDKQQEEKEDFVIYSFEILAFLRGSADIEDKGF